MLDPIAQKILNRHKSKAAALKKQKLASSTSTHVHHDEKAVTVLPKMFIASDPVQMASDTVKAGRRGI